MSNSWHQTCIQLTDFIAGHSEIEIEASRVHIPGNVRPEFYQLFDTVRMEFIEEKFPALLGEARLLVGSYTKVEEEVIKLLGLESISTSPSLRRFLHDPMDELIRGLFDPLFDLLKEKVGIEMFEEKASRNIEASFGLLYRLGYEKWVAFSLTNLLQADKLFQVILPVLLSGRESRESLSEKEVPAPSESRCPFEHEPSHIFVVPDFIVHSATLNRYVALRSEIGMALATASNASEKRQWYSFDSMGVLRPGLTVIYLADNPREISLIADVKKICRPDLIIECREQEGWFKEEEPEKVKLHHNSLKPTLGTYIVSREEVPEQTYKELVPEQVSEESTLREEQEPVHEQEPEKQGAGIYILTVGFDQTKLEPIINALMKESK